MKNSSKKVYAFYLAVAFFFTVFSFGKIAYAADSEFPVTITNATTTGTVFFSITPNFLTSGGQTCEGVYPACDRVVNGWTQTASVNTYGGGAGFMEGGYLNNTGSTPDGDYWVVFDGRDADAGNRKYFNISKTSGSWGAFVPDSGLQIDEPVDSSAHPNNPITFSGSYTNLETYNQIILYLQNSSVNLSLVPTTITLPNTSAINAPWSVTRNLPFSGAYSVTGRLWDSANSTGTPLTDPIYFYLGATSTVSTTTQANLPGSPTPIDCDTFDIGCYIKNALVWLFWPDQSSLAKFNSLSLENSFPFAYAYQIDDLRNELFDAAETGSSTIAVTVPNFGTITFLSKSMLEAVPYADLVKTILGWLLWLMGIEYIYYRILRSHDSNTA